ncbi:hypothetical protein ACFE04_007982 [Oxalis oulophora]
MAPTQALLFFLDFFSLVDAPCSYSSPAVLLSPLYCWRSLFLATLISPLPAYFGVSHISDAAMMFVYESLLLEGMTIKVCLYDDSDLPVHTEEKALGSLVGMAGTESRKMENHEYIQC